MIEPALLLRKTASKSAQSKQFIFAAEVVASAIKGLTITLIVS